MPSLNEFVRKCHDASLTAGWWDDAALFQEALPPPLFEKVFMYMVGAKFALIYSEVGEAFEGFRKSLKDDHLPKRDMAEVELGDTMIRIGDLAGFLQYDLEGAIKEKMRYNLERADHKRENRAKEGGKKI